MTSDRPLVGLRDVRASVDLPDKSTLTTVDGIDLDLKAGTSYALVGKSGSGKTSLVSIIGLLNSSYSGSYLYDGIDVAKMKDRERARMRCHELGFVFQNYSLIAHLKAWENVALPLEYGGGVSAHERRERAEARLAEVGLGGRATELPSRLSGGEQQRVAIARALVGQPRLLICDEPTGALDRDTGNLVMELLMGLVAERRTTLLLVTHDPDIAALCSHQFRMDRGKIVHASHSL